MGEQHHRETLGSRLGFLLLTAGCAIGLGNIWRFPFITGQHGGALFVLVYLAFLLLLGFPTMVMELAVGRASRRNLFSAYRDLPEGKRFRWHWPGAVFFAGNAILMSFYTTVTGWMLAYAWFYLDGRLLPLKGAEATGVFFNDFLGSAPAMVICMLIPVILGTLVCALGLRNGVELVTKVLMGALFLLLIGLSLHACMLPGAAEGLRFYLMPNLEPIRNGGWVEMVVAALGQAFFTLSIGVGSIAVFGSYIERDHTLVKEALLVIGLDTTVALLAGVIIFPVCFSFGVNPGSGPGLVFVSLPNVFNEMQGGRWWGVAFFSFMSIAALTTVVAVFENIIALMIDEFHFSRRRAALTTGGVIALLSIPSALGFNVWKSIQPLGEGSSILDFEDYLVSDNLLPLGGLLLTLFCCSRYGWGWKNFLAEANTGEGIRFPGWLRFYAGWILPAIILGLFLVGVFRRFC